MSSSYHSTYYCGYSGDSLHVAIVHMHSIQKLSVEVTWCRSATNEIILAS